MFSNPTSLDEPNYLWKDRDSMKCRRSILKVHYTLPVPQLSHHLTILGQRLISEDIRTVGGFLLADDYGYNWIWLLHFTEWLLK